MTETEAGDASATAAPEKKARMSGSGTFLYVSGARYDGDWVLDNGVKLRHGRGQFQDGAEVYDGEWQEDVMQGQGTYRFSSGARYEGTMQANKMHGKGKYTWPNGSFYEGDWRENRMHGEGTYQDEDCVQWSGAFVNGMFDNGRTYVSLAR